MLLFTGTKAADRCSSFVQVTRRTSRLLLADSAEDADAN